MNIVSIVNILNGSIPIYNTVTVNGWIRTRRDSKAGISFLNIYDGSCVSTLQAVVNNNISNYQSEILRLTTGCSISITGQVIESIGNYQHYEIQVKSFKVFGWIDNPNKYPVTSKKHSLEYLRKISHLRPRTNLIGAISRVRHILVKYIHKFLDKNGFLWIPTPLITSSDTEGIGNMFRVSTLDFENLPKKLNGKINYNKDFFGKKTFLTVSGQLNAESYACALSKIYTFGPTFRAENSNTSRHLAEFWMAEIEVAFINLNEISIFAESMLKYLFKKILTFCIDDINFFTKNIDEQVLTRIRKNIDTDFIKIDYSEAVKILQNCNQNFENPVLWGSNLSSEHEKFLTDYYFKLPVIIKNYPRNIKAFYMRVNDDEKTVASIDILVPRIGEIIGGSQREERLNKLDENLNNSNLKKNDYWWYRDLRKYGTIPHSGFGLGFERLINYITGVKNIRDVVPFPRSANDADF